MELKQIQVEAKMAAEKEERATTTGTSRRAGEAEDRKAAAERSANAAANGGVAESLHGQRRQQYLIALRSPGRAFASSPPQSADAIVDYLDRQEGVEIMARVKPAGGQPFAPDGSFAQEVVIVRMPAAKAESLRATGQPHIIVERDGALTLPDGVPAPMQALSGARGFLPLSPIAAELALRVTGESDQPLARASIVVYGPGFPAQAMTDESGAARLSLFGGGPDRVRAIYVKPRANHWERLIVAPELNESGATTIRLRPFSETFPNFATERVAPWSQRLMRLDQLGKMDGAGVRVGIVDSGCDNTQPSLRHIVRGKDFTSRDDGQGAGQAAGQRSSKRSDTEWTDDVLGYGTHSAGIVAAAAGAQGIAGAAPKVELHVLKVFPGGRLSDLLAALDECAARELDLVSLSVGYDEPSELLDQKLGELRHKGIACIAAAGSQPFPAVLPSVLAVGAIGRLHEFPPDTCHAEAVIPELIGPDGLFPAAFTGAGPHVALAAPGVAVVSTVPGGYAALDGTGIAAAHVAGLAALVLAHHPLFQGPLKGRSEQRVSTLFGLLRASAAMLLSDPLRSGAGVPNLQRVPGLFGGLAGAEDLRSFAAPGPGMMPGIADALASGPFPSAWMPAGWQALMQMRAAGLI
jgi:subtilisin family serine protease